MADHPPSSDPVAVRAVRARRGELVVRALPDRADDGPRRRRVRDPVVGVAAEEARGLEPAKADGQAGYRLSASAVAVLREGDARIWSRPRASVGDGWLIVVLSVPEAERGKRHELRSLLTRLGFGTAAPGVWIAPGTAYDETLAGSTAPSSRRTPSCSAAPTSAPARPTYASASGGTCRRSPRSTTSSSPTTAP